MKKLKLENLIPIVFILLSLSVVGKSAADIYARRIFPVYSDPVVCSENQIMYQMVTHKLYICKNTGPEELAVGAGNIASINGLSDTDQTFAIDDLGTDVGITSAASVHTFSFPTASLTKRGLLSSVDWGIFNSKQDALGFAPENASNKNLADGYAGLISGKLALSQMQEVIGVTDLTTYSTTSGTGSTAIRATFSSLATNDCLIWDGTNWINSSVCGGGGGGGGITEINALNALSQTLVTGTGGTDFNISSAGSVHTFNIPTASATNRGLLSTSDWTTFNGKQNPLGYTPENVANKDTASGYAGLTAGSKITTSQVQEVLGISDLTDFTAKSGSGTTGIGATFTGLASNDCLQWNGSNWINTSNCGTITSVFGRTGVVVAANNDYSFSQISGSVADGQLSANVPLKNAANVFTGVNNFNNNLGIGTATFGVSAAKVLGIADGTAPTTAPANMVQLWSQNFSDTYSGSVGSHLYSKAKGASFLHHISVGEDATVDQETVFGGSYGPEVINVRETYDSDFSVVDPLTGFTVGKWQGISSFITTDSVGALPATAEVYGNRSIVQDESPADHLGTFFGTTGEILYGGAGKMDTGTGLYGEYQHFGLGETTFGSAVWGLFRTSAAAGTVNNARGGYFYIDNNFNVPINSARAVEAGIINDSSGTINAARVYDAKISNTSTGIYTDVVGYRLQPAQNSGGGVITQLIGLEIMDQSGITGVTNFYNIWSKGVNAPNVFDGALTLGGINLTSDIVTTLGIIRGQNVWAQSTVNTTGGNVMISGGLGRRFFTSISNTAGAVTVTIVVNGSSVALASGVHFTLGSDNTAPQLLVTTTNLAAAINANATLNTKVVAAASTDKVYLTPRLGTYTLDISSNQAARISATSGIDGTVRMRKHMSRLTNSAATLNIPAATATSITFNAEDYDNGELHSTSANTSRITVTQTGKYLLTGGLVWSAQSPGTATFFITRFTKNGTPIAGARTYYPPISSMATNGLGQNLSITVSLTAGDYVEMQAYQDSAGTLTVDLGDSSFQATYLGE